MVRSVNFGLTMGLLVLSFVAACGSSNEADKGGRGAQVTVVGSWLGVFESPAPVAGGTELTAGVVDIDHNSISVLFYGASSQVAAGWMGEYEFNADENGLSVTADYRWDKEQRDWIALDPSTQLPYEYSFEGETMTVVLPEGNTLELTRTEFEWPRRLVGEWTLVDGDNRMHISLTEPGEYQLSQVGPDVDDYSESGQWSAIHGAGRFLRTIADTVKGSPTSIEGLTRYNLILEGDRPKLELFWPHEGEEVGFIFKSQSSTSSDD